MGLSKEARELLYTRMYIAVSKATAETKNVGGEIIKSTYNGTLTDLFNGLCNSSRVVTAFMWAITHKTEILPTQLFKAVDHGTKGYEISRVHSGFYDDQKNHIVGTSLIPFIMDAMKLWKPTPRKVKKKVIQEHPTITPESIRLSHEIELATSLDNLRDVGEDALIYFGEDAQKRYDKAKSDLDIYHTEMQRREQERKNIARKQEVRKAIVELIESEGFTLEEIIQIV